MRGQWRGPGGPPRGRPRLLSGHRPPAPTSKKLFFHLERLRVAMKTDFPRGPTLPLRGIGLEKPKWPESRDKKGPLSGGLERESRGRFTPSAPHTLPTPPPVSASARPGQQAADCSPSLKPAESVTTPVRSAVLKPVSRAPVPHPGSILGAQARGFPAEGPSGTAVDPREGFSEPPLPPESPSSPG